MLTESEMKVSELLLQGLSDKEICKKLNILSNEIANLKRRIFKKHGVSTRYQFIVKMFNKN